MCLSLSMMRSLNELTLVEYEEKKTEKNQQFHPDL